MDRYRSKPVEIEAVQLTDENILAMFGNEQTMDAPMGLELQGWADQRTQTVSGIFECKSRQGVVVAEPGDWIILEPGAPGLCYPCKPDVFAARWEAVDAPAPAA
jgi:hypothetical protein